MISKKTKCLLSILLSLSLVACGSGKTDTVDINDSEVPLSPFGTGYIQQMDTDVNVIPDKYNTGCSGELTIVDCDTIISGVKFGTSGSSRKLDLAYQPRGTVIPDILVVENIDFSSCDFVFQNGEKYGQKASVVFNNCKFKSFAVKSAGQVDFTFNNCTLTHFGGANASFMNCYIGSGTDGDGVNPTTNCSFTNCYIADLIRASEVNKTNHVDGFQIFGSTDGTNNENISFENCRFEVPYMPFTYSSGALNCPVSVIMRYSDAINITFNNVYINGGLYYGLMFNKISRQIIDCKLSNIHIGGASKILYASDDADLVKKCFSNVGATDSLYVASVRNLDDGIHLSVTNDTNQERVLLVYTENEFYEFTIPACPVSKDLAVDSTVFSDFPFDIDFTVPNSSFVVCYDATGGEPKQIRFVNWNDSQIEDPFFFSVVTPDELGGVYCNDEIDSIFTPVESDIIVKCGDNATFAFSDGILSINGTGATYNYNSANTAPWYDYADSIVSINISEGITTLGDQLFVGCNQVKSIALPESLVSIGSNVFKKCSSLKEIYLPESVVSIGDRSFTSSLNSVTFGGTSEEFFNIKIGKYNNGLLDASIQFTANTDKEETSDIPEANDISAN